jgi:hypothetical protein
MSLASLTAQLIVAAKATPSQAAAIVAATKSSAKSFAEKVKEEEARILAAKK